MSLSLSLSWLWNPKLSSSSKFWETFGQVPGLLLECLSSASSTSFLRVTVSLSSFTKARMMRVSHSNWAVTLSMVLINEALSRADGSAEQALGHQQQAGFLSMHPLLHKWHHWRQWTGSLPQAPLLQSHATSLLAHNKDGFSSGGHYGIPVPFCAATRHLASPSAPGGRAELATAVMACNCHSGNHRWGQDNRAGNTKAKGRECGIWAKKWPFPSLER